jgi:hypothetical protein
MDDSFAKGWTLISGYSFESDGDVASLVADASVDCIIEKTFPASLSSDVYTRLQARITDVDATTDVLLYNESLAAWDLVLTATTPGLVEVSLLAGKVYTKIRLKIPTISYADIDYVAICKNSMLIPDMGDLVDELRVTRPLLNSGIAGAKLSIPNLARAIEYPTCFWWPTGTYLPETYSTENLMDQSWNDDETWNYYMALIDYWTTQNENGNALYDFGSAKNTTFYVKWKGILTPHTATGSGRVECKIYAGLTSVVSEMTLVKQHTLTSPIGGPSVTFDMETVSFSGNYRYIFIYFTTFGDFSGQTYLVVLPTKLWVNGVWRDLF